MGWAYHLRGSRSHGEGILNPNDARRQRLAAILAADAAGYSRLMSGDETGTLAALDTARAVFRLQIETHHGRVIDMAGDSVLAVFETATGAVSAALAAQEQLESLVAGVPADRRMRFRIGVHLGDVIEKPDGTVYGEGVNIAARLEGLALPGGVTISDAVHGAVRHRVAATFEDLGEQQVKNIVDPVRAFRVLGADLRAQGAQATGPSALPGQLRHRAIEYVLQHRALAAVVAGVIVVVLGLALTWQVWRSVATPSPPAMSVAVVPLVVPTGDASLAHRAEAWTRDLTSMLALTSSAITVVPVPAAQARAGVEGNQGTSTLTRALNVRYWLEGDVRPGVEGVVLLSIRLLDGATGKQVWSGTTPVKTTDTTSAEMRALRKAADRISGSLFQTEVRRAVAQPLSDATAMDYWLRAESVNPQEAGTLQRAHEAQRLYEEALRRDPHLVPALIGLGSALLAEIDNAPNVDRERVVRRIDELSSMAMKLNGAHPDTWGLRSVALSYLGRWDAALEASEKQGSLDPYSNWSVRHAWFLANQVARPAEGLALIEQSIAADPPGGFSQLRGACEAHLLLGQYEQAIARCERARGLDSDDWWVDLFLAAAYGHRGEAEKAAAARAEVLRLVPGYSIARLKANGYSLNPAFIRLAEEHFYSGLRKAGLPEK
jgi:adenylate cyclase